MNRVMIVQFRDCGGSLISSAGILRETIKAASIKSGSLKYKLAALRAA